MDSSAPLTAVGAVIGVPLALVAYITGVELAAGRLPARLQGLLRPWLWVGPALLLVGGFLLYPMLQTVWFSLLEGHQRGRLGGFTGLTNYQWVFQTPANQEALRNNLLWLVLLPFLVIAIGTLIALLADRVRYEVVIKSIVFMPMALSAVAASVIWKFVYDWKTAGEPQLGALNGFITWAFRAQPQNWLQNPALDNYAFIVIMVWMWTGYAVVILSASLKGIPRELLEAARSDGATEPQIVWRVILPLLKPTMILLVTTLVIWALKAFEIVYALGGANFGANVIANAYYQQQYVSENVGRASALAVVLLLATLPIMYINLRRIRLQSSRV